jgi:hypothetical protein
MGEGDAKGARSRMFRGLRSPFLSYVHLLSGSGIGTAAGSEGLGRQFLLRLSVQAGMWAVYSL